MNLEDLKKIYGDEYPAAVVINGVRLPLSREGRYSRSYDSKSPRMGTTISRFMDGTASITIEELRREWLLWSESERLDFCDASDWIGNQPDFRDILRLIMNEGEAEHWSAIALSIASELPGEEALEFLRNALNIDKIESKSNFAQAISKIKHPQTESVLRTHLARTWAKPELWNNADFINWAAFDATCSIAHLIEFGVAPTDFESQVRQLSGHVCRRNQDSCRNFLSKYYSWLK